MVELNNMRPTVHTHKLAFQNLTFDEMVRIGNSFRTIALLGMQPKWLVMRLIHRHRKKY
jgi:hypothetical protein